MGDSFTSFEEARDAPPSTAQRVAGSLREEIAAGVIVPGEMLPPEHSVMQRFGVSRPTCREALRILQSEGLIEIVRGNKGGARVRAPDPRQLGAYAGVLLQMRNATIIEVYEARRLVEPDALVRVARIGDKAVLSQLAQNIASQRFLLEDRPSFYRAGRDFREIFLEHCGSETLRLIGLMLGYIADRQLSPLSYQLPHPHDERDLFGKAVAFKEALLRAMIAQDYTAVIGSWTGYLTLYVDSLRQMPAHVFVEAGQFPLGQPAFR